MVRRPDAVNTAFHMSNALGAWSLCPTACFLRSSCPMRAFSPYCDLAPGQP